MKTLAQTERIRMMERSKHEEAEANEQYRRHFVIFIFTVGTIRYDNTTHMRQRPAKCLWALCVYLYRWIIASTSETRRRRSRGNSSHLSQRVRLQYKHSRFALRLMLRSQTMSATVFECIDIVNDVMKHWHEHNYRSNTTALGHLSLVARLWFWFAMRVETM